jgi:hypothetical protein
VAYDIQNALYTKPAISDNTPIADQRLTVDATAGGVQFTPITSNAVSNVDWDCQTANCYVTFDGSAPTTTNGHLIYVGAQGTWSVARFNAAKFIREGATSAVIHASPSAI